MKNVIAVIVLSLLFVARAYCQDFDPPKPEPEKTKEPFWSSSRIYGGGGVGLWFSSAGAYVNLNPHVGYKITEKFSIGIGATYMYISDRRYAPPINLNVYGGNIFSRYLINNFLFAHAEYEPLNGNWDVPYSNERFFLHNVWAGGGFRQSGDHSSINIMALWNLNDEGYMQNPQIRIGFSIGL